MGFLLQIFTWWNGQTVGTRFFTWRKGEKVGTDAGGNTYFKERGRGRRRWVIYNGYADASTVPSHWHGWLHYSTNEVPTAADFVERKWFRPHEPNHTGSAKAYRPRGSTLSPARRPAATGDYDAWSPE
ncbi:MAG: NADH:ubiquinone oxidoreductase subunit NDUFA12 [Alphaproteobacteria bacterium]